MATIKRSTLGEQILSAVVDMIKQKQYSINDQLPTEKEIAEMLDVSRNSVREVMKTLNMAGITESIAGKGTFLRVEPESISSESRAIMDAVNGASLIELIEVRRIIETEAAALATMRAKDDPAGLIALERNLDRLLKALEVGKQDVSREGFDFHMSLVKMSGNKLLHKLLQPIMSDILEARKIIAIDRSNVALEENVHTKIVRAIESGDPETARAAVREHFDNTTVYYHKHQSERDNP